MKIYLSDPTVYRFSLYSLLAKIERLTEPKDYFENLNTKYQFRNNLFQYLFDCVHVIESWKATKFLYKILNFPLKKDKIEIHDYDLWNLDVSLATIIVPCLKRFKEKNINISPFNEDLPQHLHHDRLGTTDEDFEKGKKASEYILNEMIWAFETISDGNYGFSEHDYMNNMKRLDKGLKLFAKYYRHLWS